MRVVYLHQYFATPSMAGSTRSYELARRIAAAGHQVHIITSDRQGVGKHYETLESGIRVTWIPIEYSNSMGPSRRMRAFLSFATKSARIAARESCDVIYATSTPLTIALPAVYAKWRRRVPMVFEVRDLWPEVPIALGVISNPVLKLAAKMLEQLAYRNSSHIVAASPPMKEGIQRTGYPECRITVIPNGSDFERFEVDPEIGHGFRQQWQWLRERPLVVYTGTMGRVNGVGYLARVAALAWEIDSEVRFLVIGSGAEESQVRELAESLGVLGKNFFMLPRVPKSEVPMILSAATITTSTVIEVPELWNNSANKFFDSLAAARPIAINHEGWLADLIRSRDIGLVLPASDHSEAAHRIVEAVHDREWIHGARMRAREVGQALFNRDEHAKKLLGVLNDVTSE